MVTATVNGSTRPQSSPKTKSPLSPARLEANRLNAQKSTGPKTAEGKERSRANALKHGLSGAGVVVHAEDKDALTQRLDDWTADLRPRNSVEAWLVGRAALASVRLDRCARQERARLEVRTAADRADWLARDRRAVDETGRGLDTDPVRTLATMQSRAAGCDWLIARWDSLAAALRAHGRLSRAEMTQAARLLGEPGRPTACSAPAIVQLWAAGLGLEPRPDLDELDRCLGRSTAALTPPERLAEARQALPEPAAARAMLEAVIAAERARLADLAARLRPADAAMAQGAADWRLFDEGRTAEGMLRYERANAAEVHRCLGQLATQRKNHARHAQDHADRRQRQARRDQARAVEPQARQATPAEPCVIPKSLRERIAPELAAVEARQPDRVEAPAQNEASVDGSSSRSTGSDRIVRPDRGSTGGGTVAT